jgi:RHS repeat-associated protein
MNERDIMSETQTRTKYSYDNLNRLYQVSYNVGSTGVPATPTVTYTYGTNASLYNNGRLITMTDGLGTENYSFDQLGRRTQVQRTIYNVTYTTGYGYNLASGVTQVTHPSGRVVKRNMDAIGRLQGIQNNATSANYASSMTYNPAHQLTGFTFGNSLTASYSYTAQRSQLSTLTHAQGSTNLVSLTYGYTQNGGNNGQRTSIADGVDSGRTASYTFDSLKRLTAASTSGSAAYPAWGLSWTYDRYGNRTAQTVTQGLPTAYSTPVNSANQVTGMNGFTFTYDATGNLIQDDNYQYTYDAENRLVQVQLRSGGAVQTTYAFDGQGKRSVKVAVQQSGANRTFTLYSGTQILSEFNDASTATYTAGTTPGQAPADSVSLLLYQHQDHLTTRMTTDQQGNLASMKGHYPFGDSWYEAGAAMGSVPRKFTKYMVETELPSSILHHSTYRQHSARMGRFHIPDRVRGNIFTPQRLNRYAYVQNDPINRWDPRGMSDVAPLDDGGFPVFVDSGGGGGGGGSGDSGGSGDTPADGSGGAPGSGGDPGTGPDGLPLVTTPPMIVPGDPTDGGDPTSGDPGGSLPPDTPDPGVPADPPTACDASDPNCGAGCDLSDPSCDIFSRLDLSGRSEKQKCYDTCLAYFLTEMGICLLTPPPAQEVCVAIAAGAYYACRSRCGQ